jgi:hypothetical protein
MKSRKSRQKADAEIARNHAMFRDCVAASFPKTSIDGLLRWFRMDESGEKYAHIEIQEMWTGWNLHRDFASRQKAADQLTATQENKNGL